MRLPQEKTADDAKGKGISLEDADFRIGDDGMIMTILRDRMYANPIQITCQEVMSNARDAQREVNKPQVPIEISLPIEDEMMLRVRDHGSGISARRMNEVFIAYGCSTKRDDDVETGGFGLGAKTPWSYNDWFEINTTAYDEDLDCVMRREYRAYLNENRRSKLALKDEQPCNSETPTGTEIVIPVKDGDEQEFANSVRFVANYWELIGGVRPKIMRGELSWTDFAKITVDSDVGWMVMYRAMVDVQRRQPYAVVDGIPYPIDISSLQIGNGQANQSQDNKRLWNIRDLAISLFFETGEVDLGASRETLEYNERTIDIILFRFGVCLDLMAEKLLEPINAATDLWRALIAYRNQRADFQAFLPVSALCDQVEWQGIKVTSGAIEPNHDTWDIRLYTISYDAQAETPWKTKNKTRKIEPAKDRLLVVDDTFGKRPARSRLYTLFLQHPDIREIYVFLLKQRNCTNFLAAMTESINLNKLNPIPLSTIPPTKMPRKKSGSSGRKPAKVFVYFDPNTRVRKWTPVEVDLRHDKLVYVAKYYKDAYLDFGKRRRVPWTAESYAAAWGITIYAVVASQEGKLSRSSISLEELMKQNLEGMIADQDMMYWEREWLTNVDYPQHRLPFVLGTKSDLVIGIRQRAGDSHPIVRYADHVVELAKHRDDVNLLAKLRSDVGRGHNHDMSQSTVALLTTMIDEKYPLLYAVHGADDNHPLNTQKLLDYIEAVDNGDL